MKTTWCCISPNRIKKSGDVMHALAKNWPGARVIIGQPPDDGSLFICFGQIWLAEELISRAIPQGRKFFQVDNGFHRPSRGRPFGYYRLMYSQPGPVFVENEALLAQRMAEGGKDLQPVIRPLRRDGKHVLVALPGDEFGRAHGLDMRPWMAGIVAEIKRLTSRPIIVRDRISTRPLAQDLQDCWAVVTHSSNVAVDAILAGIPVFVAPTSMAVPVGNLSLDKLEAPFYPDGDLLSTWWASLMCQQFTIKEMTDGVAYFFLSVIHDLPVAGTVQ